MSANRGDKSRDPTTAYVVKSEVQEPVARTLRFDRQKTMYGGREIAAGDTVYIFASETQGGRGLVARGRVTSAKAVARVPGKARQTPRVSIGVRVEASNERPLGREELKAFRDRDDARPETELDFKFYRQATNKIGGITRETAEFLAGFFEA